LINWIIVEEGGGVMLTYKILERSALYQLENIVLSFIEKGYIPQGGVSHVYTYDTGHVYIQAMVKERG
jgi:hypothetical protein